MDLTRTFLRKRMTFRITIKLITLFTALSLLAFSIGLAWGAEEKKKEIILDPTMLSGSVVHTEGYYLPRNLVIPCELRTPIDTRHSQVGDMVTVQTTEDLFIGDYNIIPANSFLHGYVNKLNKGARFFKNPQVEITLETLSLPGNSERRNIHITGRIRQNEIISKSSRVTNGALSYPKKAALAGLGGATAAGLTTYTIGTLVNTSLGIATIAGTAGIGALIGASLIRRDEIRIDPGVKMEVILDEPSIEAFAVNNRLSYDESLADNSKPEDYDRFQKLESEKL
jgi:hypothetical protein